MVEADKQSWVEICSGQKTFSEFEPLAMVYAGHQFGQWAGQLGDEKLGFIDRTNSRSTWANH